MLVESLLILQQTAPNWTPVATAFVVGLPASIAAIGAVMALLQSRRNAVVAAQTAVEVGANGAKTSSVIEKVVEIHTLTNSNLSRVTSQLEVANTKLEGFAEAQRVADKKVEDLQKLVVTLVEQEKRTEGAVNLTNGILKGKQEPVEKAVHGLDEKLDAIIAESGAVAEDLRDAHLRAEKTDSVEHGAAADAAARPTAKERLKAED